METLTKKEVEEVQLVNHQAKTPEVKLILVTPEIAEKLLSRNSHNRTIKIQSVKYLADQMVRDVFNPLNGETIKIGGDLETGLLLDGQHRLSALIRANKSYEFFVAFNVDESAFTTIDVGIKRTMKDMFEISKVPNANVVSATLSTYYKLLNRVNVDDTKSGATHIESGVNNYKFTVDDLLEKYNENPELIKDACSTASNYWNDLSIIPESKIAAMILFTRLHSAFGDICIDEFWKPLFKGENIDDKPVVLTLRNMLIQQLGKRKRETFDIMLAWIIKSYNSHFTGKVIQRQAITYKSKKDKNMIFG